MNWINKLIGMVGAIPKSMLSGVGGVTSALVSGDNTKVHTPYAVLVFGIVVLIGLLIVDTFTSFKVNTTLYGLLATGVIVPMLRGNS